MCAAIDLDADQAIYNLQRLCSQLIRFCSFFLATPARSQPDKIFRVGTVDNYLPCSDLVDGRYLGLSVDLWRTVAERLNIHYELKPIRTFNSGVELASNDQFDLIASCHNITKQRLELVEYSVPYREDGLAILSKKQYNFIDDFLLFRVLSDPFLLGSLAGLCFLSLVGSFIVYKFDRSHFLKQDSVHNPASRVFKIWTKFMVGEYGVDSMNKGVVVVIIFFFMRLAVITSLVGTSVTEVFRTEKALDSNQVRDSQLKQIIQDGVAVQSGTVQEDWLNARIDKMQLDSTLKSKVLSFDAAESELVKALNSGKVSHLLSEVTLLNTFRTGLSDPDDYYISVEDPVKEFQAFVFGSNLPPHYKKSINMALAELINLGEVHRLENLWKGRLY